MKCSPSLHGVFPAMITPLKVEKSIDWDGVDRLTDWYIESGVGGLLAVGQSSEMFALTDEERLRLARRVVERADGRVPVLASGTFVRSVEAQAAFIRKMADTGVTLVVIIASQMAEAHEDDAIWRSSVARLLDLTGDIKLGLYECPLPYHRLISAKLVAWAARTKRFYLLKETSRSLEQLQAKIDAAVGSNLGIFNADATTLLRSMRMGAKGYCGIAANFYPSAIVWLCKNFASPQADRVQSLLGLADPAIHHHYPISAKAYRKLAGFDMNAISRVSDASLGDYEMRVLNYMAAQMKSLQLADGNLTAQ